MFEEIKNTIKSNKKTFLGFLIMIASAIIIFAYYISSTTKEEKELMVEDPKGTVVVKTQKAAPLMPNYGSYLQEKNSTDFLMLILVVFFLMGIFIIISSKGKK